MLKLLLFVLVGLSSFGGLIAQDESIVVLNGHFQGKNLYVQNPFAGSGVGFCAIKVTVNGDITTDEINSSAFEIDFSNFQLKDGDPVVVKLYHKAGCGPKVLNPEVLKPKSTFDVTSIKVDDDLTMKWVTENESGQLTYIVEQYRWNKWIKIGEVEGAGSKVSREYSFKVEPHSGENKFRVKQVDYTGRPRISQQARFYHAVKELTFEPQKVRDVISFKRGDSDAESLFEVYDSYGNVVKKGYGKQVDCSGLKSGMHYLNYDNKFENFNKR